MNLENKNVPLILVKFNEYKHKGNTCVIAGVLRSTKYRFNLYKKLQNTDRSSHLYLPL